MAAVKKTGTKATTKTAKKTTKKTAAKADVKIFKKTTGTPAIKVGAAVKLAADNPCATCGGKCCKHVAVPIDKPTSKGDFDDIRWDLGQKNVLVFVEEGEWYICFLTPCEFMTKEFACGIYETRPQICRDYESETCERHGEGDPYEQKFETMDEIDEFAQKYLLRRKLRHKRGSSK